jgi:hypothetical protein
MTAYVVTLEPDGLLCKKILNLKGEVRALAGDQQYLRDEPHLTLYACDIGGFASVESGFGGVAEKIRATYGPLKVEIAGWLVFKGDAVTRRDTLTCKVAGASLPALRSIQAAVVSFLNEHRRKEPLRRYAAAADGMDQAARANIDAYGYPFVGENWKPHVSIASIEPDKFPQIWQTLQEKCPLGAYGMRSLSVHGFDEETDKLSLIKRYPLK